MPQAVFGDAVFCGDFCVDKHGRHLGAQEEIKRYLYALVTLPEDSVTHSFLYVFSNIRRFLFAKCGKMHFDNICFICYIENE